MKMDEDEWMYEIMSKQTDMDYENEDASGVIEQHVDCSDAFNTSQDVLRWARSVAHENGFVAVILRSNTNIGSRGRTMFVLIGCERSGEYRCTKKEFIRRDTGTRKCGCPFKLRCKPVVGGEGWMVKLICGVHNHELVKSLVGHLYAGRLTKAEKTLIADMTKSMVKPRNILLTLKEHNANSFTTIKQIYNARSAFHSSIRGSDLEMQHMIKLLERDQYIHWHRIKDEDVVLKLVNTCNLVFLIDNIYKTNRYRLPLLDFVGVTPIGMTFSASFAYVEGERVNNLVWALQRFRGLFLKTYQALMNAMKAVFPDCTNLLCSFHINKNVKTKCKALIVQKNAWDYVMDCWGCLTDCPSEQQFDECLKKFEMACAPWPMFADYVEFAHSSLKRLLQNSLGDLCSVWDAMNNMIRCSTRRLKHHLKQVRMSLDMRSKKPYTGGFLEWFQERVDYAGKNPLSCGCMVRTTFGLPCAYELSKYVSGCIPLDSIHMFWRRLSFSDQGLFEPEVSIKEVMETISKRFEELDVCGKFTLKTKLWEIAYPDQNSMCPPLAKVNTKGAPKKATSRNPRSTKRDPSYLEYVDAFESMQNSNSSVRRTASSSEQPNRRMMMPMLDQFQPFMHDFIDKIVDVKAEGNYEYRSVAGLLGMGEDSRSVVRNHLLKELANFSEDYIKHFGGTERFEELRMSLLVDGLTKVTMDKWMDITDMGHVIASRSQPLENSSLHRIICIGHVYDNHFVELHCTYEVIELTFFSHVQQFYLKEHCPLSPVALLWSSNCHPQAKSWPNPYISRMQHYKSFVIIHNTFKLTDKQFLDEIYYRQPFTYAGNEFRTPDEFLFVGPIELLCSIARTPNGKNSKKFDIPTGCTMDELKDLIKQVAPPGIPPYGIDETQMVRQLFFQKPSHHEYSEKVIKFKIIELKTNDDMMKVLTKSNYWKKIGPIEILAVFSKLAPPQRASQMSMVLLAPTREGYLSLGPEGRLGAAEHDHLVEDLMPDLVS
ncbi:Protein FAR1-RELATED SEQUENCE 5 [Glycine soja]